MQQDTDQAEKGLYFLMVWTSTGLDFNFLSDFENGTDSLEGTTEPAVEGISTLEPPFNLRTTKPRNTSGINPSRDPEAAKLQRARAKDGRFGPTGRSASRKDYSSTTKIRTC